jgi:hypothetical protein
MVALVLTVVGYCAAATLIVWVSGPIDRSRR